MYIYTHTYILVDLLFLPGHDYRPNLDPCSWQVVPCCRGRLTAASSCTLDLPVSLVWTLVGTPGDVNIFLV